MSQTVSALARLRELILGGDLPAGERLSENGVADRIGASRTPVRAALASLAQEGLVEALPAGGYAVKAITVAEIIDSIEVRGVLEGMAARFAAERGAAPEGLDALREIVARLDAVVGPGGMAEDGFARYVVLNESFHRGLLALAGSAVLSRKMEQAVALPFASPSAFVQAQAAMRESHLILAIAQEQHRSVVEAIVGREGARAEALMREHARLSRRNLELAMRSQHALRLVPGGALIRPRSAA